MDKIKLAAFFILVCVPLFAQYDRRGWGSWIDADKNRLDTRQEVLIRDSLKPVTMDSSGRRVLYGYWVDPYSGNIFTNAKDIHIDHVVPLSHAYCHGAEGWDKKKRREYYNYLKDPGHLIAVSAKENILKSNYPPEEYLPPNKGFQKEYIIMWYTIKTNWALKIEPSFKKISNKVFTAP